jgi:hypothetical protein
MKIFISWSDEPSKSIAQFLSTWFKQVIQSLNIWVSTNNIEPGSPWFGAIQSGLAETYFGIICLTKENQHKPWIMFEAGSLAKGADQSRIFTLLLDLDSTDVTGPLASYNHTKFQKEQVYKLIETINKNLEKPLDSSVLNKAFEQNWDELEKYITEQIVVHSGKRVVSPKRTTEDMLKEAVEIIRSVDRKLSSLSTSGIEYGRYISTINQNYGIAGNSTIRASTGLSGTSGFIGTSGIVPDRLGNLTYYGGGYGIPHNDLTDATLPISHFPTTQPQTSKSKQDDKKPEDENPDSELEPELV